MNWASLFFCAICVLVQCGNSAGNNFTSFGQCDTGIGSSDPPVNKTIEQAIGEWKNLQYCGSPTSSGIFVPISHVISHTGGNSANLTLKYYLVGTSLLINMHATVHNYSMGSIEGDAYTLNNGTMKYRGRLLKCYTKCTCLADICTSGGLFKHQAIQLLSLCEDLSKFNETQRKEINDDFKKYGCDQVITVDPGNNPDRSVQPCQYTYLIDSLNWLLAQIQGQ